MAKKKTKVVPTESKKTTFRIDQGVYEKFTKMMKRLGLRRDGFLNNALVEELRLLEEAPSNTSRATGLIQLLRDYEPDPRVKVGFTLDSALIADMNITCASTVPCPFSKFS